MFEVLIRTFGYTRMSCSIPVPVVLYNSTYFPNFNLRAYAADPFYRLNASEWHCFVHTEKIHAFKCVFAFVSVQELKVWQSHSLQGQLRDICPG